MEALPTYPIQPGAEPYVLHGSQKTGILLIHGFCGAPNEMRPLANHYNALGFTVSAIRLTGHGTDPRDLHNANWTDWIQDVENGLTALSKICDDIILSGFSMGGALAVHAAAKHPEIKTLITLDSPVRRIYAWTVPIFAPISKIVPIIHPLPLAKLVMSKERRIAYDRLISHNIGYTSFSTRSFGEFFKLVNHVNAHVPAVKQRTLVIHSRKDDVVDFKSGTFLYEHIASEEKEHCWLEESRHNVLFGPEVEQIKQAVTAFLEQTN